MVADYTRVSRVLVELDGIEVVGAEETAGEPLVVWVRIAGDVATGCGQGLEEARWCIVNSWKWFATNLVVVQVEPLFINYCYWVGFSWFRCRGEGGGLSPVWADSIFSSCSPTPRTCSLTIFRTVAVSRASIARIISSCSSAPRIAQSGASSTKSSGM